MPSPTRPAESGRETQHATCYSQGHNLSPVSRWEQSHERERNHYRKPAETTNRGMTGKGIVRQRECTASDQANDAEEIHREPSVVDLIRMVAHKVEVCREAEACYGTDKENRQDGQVLVSIANAQHPETRDDRGHEEAHRCQEMRIDVHGLVVHVEQTGVGLAVSARASAVGTVDELIVPLPWLDGVPHLQQTHSASSLHRRWLPVVSRAD